MTTYLLKTEPDCYAYEQLERDGRATWDGLTNAAALIHLRSMRKGDQAFIYHTGDEKSIVGLAQAVSDPFEDPAQPGLNARNEPKFAVIDLKPVRRAATPVTLARVKADARFAAFPLVTQSRLGAMPVPSALDKILRAWAGW